MAEEEVKSLTAPVELTKEALKRDRCVCGGEYACKREKDLSQEAAEKVMVFTGSSRTSHGWRCIENWPKKTDSWTVGHADLQWQTNLQPYVSFDY